MTEQEPKSIPSRERRALVVLHIMLVIVSSIIAYKCYSVVGISGQFLFLVWVTVSCIAAAICRWGCLLPCTLMGMVLGATLDPAVKHGSHESQVIETIWFIVLGTLLGVGVGVLLDVLHAENQRKD